MFKTSLFTLTAGALLAAGSATAATITWGTATTISSSVDSATAELDVITTGTLVGAVNVASTIAPTVNGVTFSASGVTGNFNANNNSYLTSQTLLAGFAEVSAKDPSGTNAVGAADNTFGETTSSDSYDDLVDGAIFGGSGFTSNGGIIRLRLLGLDSDQEYAVQLWTHDGRSDGSGRSTTVSDAESGGNSVSLDHNSTDATGGLGQFVVGTFTADGATQDIFIYAANSAQFNAVQLRAVPEPGSLALMGLGGLCLLKRRRRD